MRLSYSLTLSLLSFNYLSEVSARINQQPEARPATPAAIAKGSSAGRRRRLQKVENRLLQKGNGNGNGGNSGSNGNGSTVDGSSTTTTRGNGNGNGRNSSSPRGGNPNSPHSSHLDTNDNGITLPGGIEYEYGTPIDVTFDLTNDLVDYETQLGLNLEEMPNWTLGVFMRMADPQGGSLEAIASVSPDIFDAPTRKLQEEETSEGGIYEGGETNTETTTTEPQEPEMETEVRDPPTLNHQGSGTFAAALTDASTLDPLAYGTGFDIYLLDENGAAIIGPATFYMLKTADMEAAELEASQQTSSHPLAKYNHSQKKKPKGQGYGKGGSGAAAGGGKHNGKVQGGAPDDKGKGYGSGANGGMIIGTTESLATYILETNKLDYVMGEDVTVTYDLSPEIMVDGRRMLKNNGNGNGNGNGGGNGNSPPSDTTTTQATTTNVATTTEATTTPDMTGPEDNEIEMPTEIDNTDITLYSMGVYMRMAHPQGGQLAPIHSLPFCTDPADTSNCVPEDLESGTMTFSTDVLDLKEYGGGYDVWILNGSGEGIAGPFTFYVAEAVEP